MKSNKDKFHSFAVVAFAVFLVSPLDDILISALFGTAVFGFGSTPFYLLLIASSTVSVLLWKRNELTAAIKRHGLFPYRKTLENIKSKFRV